MKLANIAFPYSLLHNHVEAAHPRKRLDSSTLAQPTSTAV
jgi:hypothetical protein